jgi:hypothetical protein
MLRSACCVASSARDRSRRIASALDRRRLPIAETSSANATLSPWSSPDHQIGVHAHCLVPCDGPRRDRTSLATVPPSQGMGATGA